MCTESWIIVINLHVLTLSKYITNFIQKNFNSSISTIVGIFDTSYDSVMYWKHFKCEYPYNGIRWGVWFVYIRPKGGEAHS